MTYLSAFASPQKLLAEHDSHSIQTTDGNVVSRSYVKQAIRTGAGIFIGDFFVGTTEYYFLVTESPKLKY